MARKSRDEYVEKLEKEVRALKSTNRQLTRRLRKIDKKFRETLELEEEEQRKAPRAEREPEVPFDCPKCSKGHLKDIPLGIKVLWKCTKCDYKETKGI